MKQIIEELIAKNSKFAKNGYNFLDNRSTTFGIFLQTYLRFSEVVFFVVVVLYMQLFKICNDRSYGKHFRFNMASHAAFFGELVFHGSPQKTSSPKNACVGG